MRRLPRDRALRGLFLTSGTALGSLAMSHCGSTAKSERTETTSSALMSPPVVTHHNDNNRSGSTGYERVLAPSNVSSTFGYLYDLNVTGMVYAQPLVATNVNIGGTYYPYVLYVVTMHNMVYAFDATASTPTLLLSTNLEPPAPAQDTTIGGCYPADSRYLCFGTQRPTSNNIPGEIGILSTPVIVGNSIYLITNTGSGTSNHHVLHELDLGGLNDVVAPQPVTSSDPSFQGYMQIQRPALLASNGMIYAAFGAYCDQPPYHGYVIAFGQSDLKSKYTWNSTPTSSPAEAGGIWQSGNGPAADSSGNVYVLTGNGHVNNDSNIVTGGSNTAEAMIELNPTLSSIVSWFVPSDYPQLNANDGDVGSGGVLLVPATNIALGGGKDSNLYVGQQGNLGQYPNPSVQTLSLNSGEIHGAPVFWNNNLYVWATSDELRSFPFNGTTFGTSQLASMPEPNNPGAMLSVSGNAGANGIVWAARSVSGVSAVYCPQQGALAAFDATNVKKLLWDSAYEVASPGFVFSKNAPPTTCNGRVFLSAFGPMSNITQQPPTEGLVRVFGLGAPALGFGASTEWSNAAFYGTISSQYVVEATQVADVNGDGLADAVAFDGTNGVYVMTSNGTGFNAPTRWTTSNFYGSHDAYSTWLGDVDGKYGADAVAFDGDQAYVMLSNGSGFGPPTRWSGPGVNFYGTIGSQYVANATQLADVSGDGLADAVAFDGSNGVYVMTSNGNGFNAPKQWSTSNFYGTHDAYSTWLANVDGKYGADAVAFDGNQVYVMLSNGSGFGPPTSWSGPGVNFYGTFGSSYIANPVQVADVNGDGKADAVVFDGTTSWVMLSNGSGFRPPTQWSGTYFYGTNNAFSTWLGDVNHDGLADAVGFDGGSTYVMLGAR